MDGVLTSPPPQVECPRSKVQAWTVAGRGPSVFLNAGHGLGARQPLHVGVDFHSDVRDAIFEDSYLHFFFFSLS